MYLKRYVFASFNTGPFLDHQHNSSLLETMGYNVSWVLRKSCKTYTKSATTLQRK